MDRRRALMAASMQSGGGGEFYIDFYKYNPKFGESFFKTATFVLDSDKTWEEAIPLKDTEDEFEIKFLTMPNGTKILTAFSDSYNYGPREEIYSTDKIIIGNTYEFVNG